jgi:hypothetical protein
MLRDEFANLRTDLVSIRWRCAVATLIVVVNLAATFMILGVLLGR